MVILYILLGILLLIFLISLIRVQVFLLYSEDLTLSLKILFFKIKLLPQDETKKKEKKPKRKRSRKRRRRKRKNRRRIKKKRRKSPPSSQSSRISTV